MLREVSSRVRFLQAAVFSAIVCLPLLYILFNYGHDSILLLGPDDPTYLSKIWNLSNVTIPFREELYFLKERGSTTGWGMLLSRSNMITDIAVGFLLRPFASSPGQLGVILDLICVGISFALFRRLYELLAGSRSICSDLAAVVTVVAPYLWVEGSQASIFSLFGGVMPVRYLDYDPPAFRAVYTQVSFCIFPLCLLPLASMSSRSSISLRAVSLSAALSGLLIYVYFFAFVSVSFLSFGFLLYRLCHSESGRPRWHAYSVRLIIQYVGIHLLVCIFGLAVLFASSEGGIVKSEELKSFFYLPWSVAFQCLVTLIVVMKTQPGSEWRQYSTILLLCIVAEILLPNLQPLLGQAIAPFHFHRFFSQPLFSGIVTLFILRLLAQYRRSIFSLSAAAMLLVLVALFHFGYSTVRIDGLSQLSEETSELFRFVKSNIPRDAILAVAPEPITRTSRPVVVPLANMLVLETERRVLFQHWCTDGRPSREDVEREILLSYYLLGTPRPFLDCRRNVSLPGDIFYLTATAYQLARVPVCQLFDDAVLGWNALEATKRFPVDYIISVRGMELPSAPLERFIPVWKSSHGEYVIYSVRGDDVLSRSYDGPSL